MLKQGLLGSQVDAIWMADTQQAIYQHLMQTFSRPGRIDDLSCLLENKPAYLGVLATLLDNEVSLSDVDDLLEKDHWPLLQTVSESVEDACYLLCEASKKSVINPKLGSLSSPELSATLILKVDHLASIEGDDFESNNNEAIFLKLTGPGIERNTKIQVSGMDPTWLEQRNEWCSSFPLGVDFLLVDRTKVVGLPRTTQLQILGVH